MDFQPGTSINNKSQLDLIVEKIKFLDSKLEEHVNILDSHINKLIGGTIIPPTKDSINKVEIAAVGVVGTIEDKLNDLHEKIKQIGMAIEHHNKIF